MLKAPSNTLFLFAEDDDEDWMLIQDTFEHCHPEQRIERVRDGVALLERLNDPDLEMPGLILLDLKMPLLNGHETLERIRAAPSLRHIPVVIMTSSRSESDIWRAYYAGANSYIVKPVEEATFHKMKTYWTDVVSLPRPLLGSVG